MKRIKGLFKIGILLISLFLVFALSACSLFFPRMSKEQKTESYTQTEEAKSAVNMAPAEYDSSINDMVNPYVVPDQTEWNTEEYSSIQENGFLSVAANPFSTFGADVDTASYTHVRRFLTDNQILPPPDSVRIEELVNYYPYQYDEPKDGSPLAVNLEWSDTPWNPDTKLLSIGLQAEKIDNSKRDPANLVFLIDVSGSMWSEDKLPLVKKAFRLLTENLSDNDRVSIVTYAGSEQIAGEGLSGQDRNEIMRILDELEAGGSTHGSAGIITAYELAEKYYIPGGSNRVILATDGDLNVGVTSEGDLVRMIEEKKQGGVYLTVLGFGQGNIKDNKMEALADKGDGQYAMIDSILEARRVLVEEMGAQLNVVAKDVKLQVEFNPALVKGYRLIGYENRLMNAEDFADDSKDGGEMGSGHRVTALYEVVFMDSPMEIEAPSGRYQNQAGSGDNEKGTVMTEEACVLNIRYKAPVGGESTLETHPIERKSSDKVSEMSDNLKVASMSAAFGMKLRESEFIGDYTYEEILKVLRSVKEGNPTLDELTYLVGRAEKLSN